MLSEKLRTQKSQESPVLRLSCMLSSACGHACINQRDISLCQYYRPSSDHSVSLATPQSTTFSRCTLHPSPAPSSTMSAASSSSSTPLLQSWVPVETTSDFPIQNLPYGVFTSTSQPDKHIGVAIGSHVLDLHVLASYGLFSALPALQHGDVFKQPTLNAFMALPRAQWIEARKLLTHLLANSTPTLRDNAHLRSLALVPLTSVTMHLPCVIGDYTDFYSSRNHAFNIGRMWRGEDKALQPNYLHLPVGYHGRSSSILPTNTPLHRPRGQTSPDDSTPPALTTCRILDFELEVGVFLGGPENPLGHPISLPATRDRMFGLVLLNDWSARDIQRWEYVPLGPFTGKNFATTISPWVVTFEALEPFRCPATEQLHPAPLPYLTHACNTGFDVGLDVCIVSEQSVERVKPKPITRSNTKHLYWTFQQQITHHSITGCNMRAGDLLGSGTISGTTPAEYGSLIELSWKGEHDVDIGDEHEGGGGGKRKFLRDGDEVVLTGRASRDGLGYSIGFGECRGKILPAVEEKDWV